MYNLLHNTYILLSKMRISSHMRMYGRGSNRLMYEYNNAFKNGNECVNNNIKKMGINKYVEELFKCELTNKQKRAGNIDCNCEKICDVNKSEIKIIEDSVKI
jgi:hypothetical protein